LREVRALIGFSRVNPVGIDDMEKEEFVSIKDEDWYPGYEVRGEGIFLKFDMEKLERWSKTDFVIKREEVLVDNYENSSMHGRISEFIDSKYIMLHTLSHLLLKQLSFECGYNIASLRERIYYKPQVDDEMGMAGILLYTANGDSEGTLGGLIRQGREDCFPRIFKAAVEKAKLCSNDPVCITSKGQGRESLNLAACHSCALIPETSCELFNSVLDRALIVGTFEEPDAGYYSSFDNYKEEPNTKEERDSSNINDLELRVCDDGQVQSSAYTEIWAYIQEDTENIKEIKLFDELIEKSTGNYEKPIYCGSVEFNDEIVSVDLIWKKSKVLFFLSDNIKKFEKIKDSNWKCLCIADKEIDADTLLELIAE
jgi:hypothetical protein